MDYDSKVQVSKQFVPDKPSSSGSNFMMTLTGLFLLLLPILLLGGLLIILL